MSNYYNKNKRFVFIHVPKTGGYSLREGDFLPKPLNQRIGRIPDTWDYDFSFCFVRNPVDRLISVYKMFKFGGTSCQNPTKPDLNIHKLLDIIEDKSINYKNNRNNINEYIKHHALPMSHPYNCIQHADKIYRFENFQESVEDIKKRLNISRKIQKLNQSRGQVQKIDKETLQRIKEVYKQDFKEYGYD